MTADEPAHYHDLDAVRGEAFALIAGGVRDRDSPFHTPVLATLGVDGFPAARTVVLRGFDAAARVLTVHTDRRSTKIADLAANPRVSFCFYDAGRKIQVRAIGEASVHIGDDVAAAAWERVAAFSRRCYLGAPPGALSDTPTSGLPADLEGRAPAWEESEPGFAHFAVIRATIHRLDWLYLAAKGQRRARLDWDPDGTLHATWLAP